MTSASLISSAATRPSHDPDPHTAAAATVSSSDEDDDDDDVLASNSLVHREMSVGPSQQQSYQPAVLLSAQTDCDNVDLLSHPPLSTLSLRAADTESVYTGAMATHRMPATLPLTTSKQHPYYERQQSSGEAVGLKQARSQSINNNDSSHQ